MAGPDVEARSSLNYSDWSTTCDTLHAHVQLLGKLSSALAPPEPQLQHAALRLTARGWETCPLPVQNRSAAIVMGLDLHQHKAFIEHSDGRRELVALSPDRSVGAVTRGLLALLPKFEVSVEIDPTPQEVWWSVPLDEDEEHASYDISAVKKYFACATRAALVLAAFRAPYRGRSTPVNAWWGSFDLAVSLFSGQAAQPPSEDFIMRNAMDSEEVAVGWWPGDPRHEQAAFYAYAHPAKDSFSQSELPAIAGKWNAQIGEYVLNQDEVVSSAQGYERALQFARAAFHEGCVACGWDPALLASTEGNPPPLK